MDFLLMVLRKSFYIHWSAGRSPRVHEVNPGRDPSISHSHTNDLQGMHRCRDQPLKLSKPWESLTI